MKAIVLLYQGKPVDVQTAEMLIGALATVLEDGYSQPEIKYISDEELAKELIKCSTPPTQCTEDGDASVKVIMGMIPTSVLENRLHLAVALTRQLAVSSTSNDAKDHAFVRAMSYIAQGQSVSPTVAKQYHFTKMIRDVVKEVYNSYLNM